MTGEGYLWRYERAVTDDTDKITVFLLASQAGSDRERHSGRKCAGTAFMWKDYRNRDSERASYHKSICDA